MQNLSTKIALLAVLGSMTATSPVLAAPPHMQGNAAPLVDCTINATDPSCVVPQQGNRRHGSPSTTQSTTHTDQTAGATGGTNSSVDTGNPGPTNNGSDQTGNSNAGDSGGRQAGMTGNGRGNANGNGPSGYNFSGHDRDQFHQRFRGFDFGTFATPSFSIRIGTSIPHSYRLRSVPRSIYKYYPQFRHDLYFTRGNDIVIVSARNHRILGVI